MTDFFSRFRVEVGECHPTAMNNAGDIYQDGTTPLWRDTDGTLWGMSGHSHMGHIAMLRGRCLEDLQEVYPIQTQFAVGKAGDAFDGVRYPEGILPRGSIWPFGLYICPVTHRFFCFFHNETAWNGHGTGYDAWGLCETPKLDTDFRHIGLMHSDDEGRHWQFDRWVLTGETVGFTEKYNPNGDGTIGQPTGVIRLGSGDFSLFADEEFLYLFYNVLRVDMTAECWHGGDVFVARTRRRTDGVMGDFVKYYEGAFCEAGNLGKETPIATDSWHPRVVYLKNHHRYLMSSCALRAGATHGVVEDVIQLRVSDDLLHWSEPIRVTKDGRPFGNHYCAVIPKGSELSPFVCDDRFYFCLNHNGTDVLAWDAELVASEKDYVS